MPKMLLVFVPAFLVLTLLSTRMLLDYGRGQARDAMAARIGALSGRVALAVGTATHGPAPADPKLLRSLLATMSGEAAFVCAEVLQADGTRLAAWPAIGCDPLDQPATEIRLPIADDKGGEQGAPPLAMRLRYTEAVLRDDTARLGVLLALGGTASFCIALLALWLGYRLWLNPPIARLLASIRVGTEANMRRPVQWASGDELGQIVAAYNGLIAREDAREAALRGLNYELEARVRDRTLELQSSEARLREIIDTSADGIVTTDARGIVRSANRAAEAMFGRPAAALTARPLSELLADGADAGPLLGNTASHARSRQRYPTFRAPPVSTSPAAARGATPSRWRCMSPPSRRARTGF
jgi:PAS domain-containing protein